jgi:multidrug resistance protein, MATE family
VQVAAVLAIALVEPALARFSYSPDVRALLADYLALRLWSGGAAVGLEALANYYGGLGYTRLPTVA